MRKEVCGLNAFGVSNEASPAAPHLIVVQRVVKQPNHPRMLAAGDF